MSSNFNIKCRKDKKVTIRKGIKIEFCHKKETGKINN